MKKSSLQILAVVVIMGIITGILLISVANAGNFSVKKMPVEITIKIDGNKIAETNAEEITIKAFKGQEVEIDFKARIVNCESCLDIIEIKDKKVYLLLSTIGGNKQNSGCLASGTLTLVPEENIEYFNFVFLSSGKNKYGAGVGDKTIQELLEDWKDLKSKTVDTMITSIRGNTVDSGASDDSITTRKIKVKIEEPKIDIDWEIRNGKLEIYGTTNLPKNTIIEWRFVDPSIRIEGCIEVNWNRRIGFTIDNINAKEIKGNLILEKDGKFIAEETIIWSKTPTTTPTIEKFTPPPVSRSYSPEISESKPTPTWPPNTTIPGIPETETPGMNWLSIFLAIAATAFLKKRKK